MGIPMIHATADDSGARIIDDSTSLQDLINVRKEIEASLNEYASTLDRNHTDLTSPLLSPDGFPRSDIDVANVRIARTAIIRLRNDHKAIEKRIEDAVHRAFESGSPLNLDRAKSQPSRTQVASAAEDVAFCFVNSVVDNSPAASAGIIKDDKIIKFGSATFTNHDRLQGLAREVQRAVAQESIIKVTLSRKTPQGTAILNKDLKPNTSSGGRGAVGAHFMPC